MLKNWDVNCRLIRVEQMSVNEYGTVIHSVSGQLVCAVKAGTLVLCQLLMFQYNISV